MFKVTDVLTGYKNTPWHVITTFLPGVSSCVFNCAKRFYNSVSIPAIIENNDLSEKVLVVCDRACMMRL